MMTIFRKLKVLPDPIDYPVSLIGKGLLGRDVWRMKLREFIEHFSSDKPYFVKPVVTKLFHGRVIENLGDLDELKHLSGEINVFVSDKINIISEHRAYVHNKELVYCNCYHGDFRIDPDYSYIDNLIKNYKDQPIAYTIDVAVTADMNNCVVECNDFWSIGSYGINPILYARMLEDRYFEIISA